MEHHFIAFVQKDGCVYELDGRKSGPVSHGTVGDSFTKVSTVAFGQVKVKSA